MNFKLPLYIIFVLCIFCLPSCENKEEESSPAKDNCVPVYDWSGTWGHTLTLWLNEKDLSKPYIKRALERYEKLTGNTLNIVAMTQKELENKLIAGFKGQTDLPDVFLFPSGSGLLPMHPERNFHDFTHAPWIDDLTATALSQSIGQGKVIGLPHWEGAISGFIYNKKIFDEFKLSVPRTLKEFLQTCEKLLEHGVYPFYLPFQNPELLSYQIPLSSLLQDNTILEELNDKDINYADLSGFQKIVDWYRIMASRGFLGPNFKENSLTGMNEALKSGRYAMAPGSDNWLYSDFTGNPNDFGLMPAFIGTPEEGSYEGPHLMLFIVNENSPKKTVGIDFVTFLADPCNYNSAFAGVYTTPVFKKQTGSLTTPQYDRSSRTIERLLRESLAQNLLHGFSQEDALYIERYMTDPAYSIVQCIHDMDSARLKRMQARD